MPNILLLVAVVLSYGLLAAALLRDSASFPAILPKVPKSPVFGEQQRFNDYLLLFEFGL